MNEKTYMQNVLAREAKIENIVQGRVFNNFKQNVLDLIPLLKNPTQDQITEIKLVAEKIIRPEHLYGVFGMPMPVLEQYKQQAGLLPEIV